MSNWQGFYPRLQLGEHMYCGKGENGFGHHGVYLDKDHQMVIHFQGPSSSSHDYSLCKSCRYIPHLPDGWILTCRKCFLVSQLGYIRRYIGPEHWESRAADRLVLEKAPVNNAYNDENIYLALHLDYKLYALAGISIKCKFPEEVKIVYAYDSSEIQNSQDFAKRNECRATLVNRNGELVCISIECRYRFHVRRKIKVNPPEMLAGYSAMTNEPEDMKWPLSNNNVDQIDERVTKTKSKSVFPVRKHIRTKLCKKLARNSSKRKDSERHSNLGPDGHTAGFLSKIQPGDHIYTERKNDKYHHHEDMKWQLSNNKVDQIDERVTKTKSKSVFPVRKHIRTKLCEKLARNSSKRKDSKHHGNLGRDRHVAGFLSKIQPGDHIYTERKNDKYQHHGIYEGKNRVIHFQRPSKTHHHSACRSCGYIPPKRGGRVHTCLDCFCNNELCNIIRYKRERSNEEWRNMEDFTWDHIVPGKAFYGYNSEKIYIELCLDNELYAHVQISKEESSKYKVEFDHQIKLSRFSSSKSAKEVISTAKTCNTKRYCLFWNNCEHFAVYCKTDNGRSIQVQNLFRKPGKSLHMVLAKKPKIKQVKMLPRNSSKKKGSKGKERLLNQGHHDHSKIQKQEIDAEAGEKIQDQSDSCCLPWFRRGNPYSKLGEPKPQKVKLCGAKSKLQDFIRRFSRKDRKTV